MPNSQEPSGEFRESAAGQIGQTIQSGLPLESGLRALAEQTRSARTKHGLRKLADLLEQGVPLEKSLQTTDIALPLAMKSLVEAGTETGRLDALMQYSIGQSQRSNFLRQQIWLAISYPIFILVFAKIYCLFVLLYLVPMFKKIFDDFGTELPGLTTLMVGCSDFLVNIFSRELPTFLIRFSLWLLLMAAILVGLVKWIQARSTSLPFIGRVFRYAALANFCQVLALLTESGMQFAKSVRIAGGASQDPALHRRCRSMSETISEGALPDAAAEKVGLPNTLVQVFHNAGSGSSLSGGLRGLSEIYSAQSYLNSHVILSMIGPLIMVCVAIFIGFVTLSLFMPLIKLLNDLS